MIARRCVPELETHTAFHGINDGVKVMTVDEEDSGSSDCYDLCVGGAV